MKKKISVSPCESVCCQAVFCLPQCPRGQAWTLCGSKGSSMLQELPSFQSKLQCIYMYIYIYLTIYRYIFLIFKFIFTSTNLPLAQRSPTWGHNTPSKQHSQSPPSSMIIAYLCRFCMKSDDFSQSIMSSHQWITQDILPSWSHRG